MTEEEEGVPVGGVDVAGREVDVDPALKVITSFGRVGKDQLHQHRREAAREGEGRYEAGREGREGRYEAGRKGEWQGYSERQTERRRGVVRAGRERNGSW